MPIRFSKLLANLERRPVTRRNRFGALVAILTCPCHVGVAIILQNVVMLFVSRRPLPFPAFMPAVSFDVFGAIVEDEADVVGRLLDHGSLGDEDRAGQRAEQGRLRRADTDRHTTGEPEVPAPATVTGA